MPAEKHSSSIALPPSARDAADSFSIRCATRSDGARMWQLVNESGLLDRNSCYAYLLLGEHFGDTCLVAEGTANGCAGLAGFVAAYRPPAKPEVIFVWQIGVAAWAQRCGLAKRLLQELVQLPACRSVRFLEATITPTNVASQRLFSSFAEDLQVAIHTCGGFSAGDFCVGEAEPSAHEPEELYRIGPFAARPLQP